MINSTFTSENDAIRVRFNATDLWQSERSITFYFFVPIRYTPSDWSWGFNARTDTPINPTNGPDEYVSYDTRSYGFEQPFTEAPSVGATGQVNPYPWAGMASASLGNGVAIAVPPVRPGVYRMGYNAALQRLYIAFDVGFSRVSSKSSTYFEFYIFGFDTQASSYGSVPVNRAISDRYQSIFSSLYSRAVVNATGGTMARNANLTFIGNISDFGLRYNIWDSLATASLALDTANRVSSIRFPLSNSLVSSLPVSSLGLAPTPATLTFPTLQNSLTSSLSCDSISGLTQSIPSNVNLMLSTASSTRTGVYYQLTRSTRFTCGSSFNVSDCLSVFINPNPNLPLPNKYSYEFTSRIADLNRLTMSGDLMDRFFDYAFYIDYSAARFSSSSFGLSFGSTVASFKVGVPLFYNLYEFATRVRTGLGSNRFLIGPLFDRLPLGFDLFDAFRITLPTTAVDASGNFLGTSFDVCH